MKKFYTLALAAVLAFGVSAQKVTTNVLPRQHKHAVKLEKIDAQHKAPSAASYTAQDVAGTYYASATSYLNGGTDMKNQEFTVTVNASGELELVGFYSTYAIKGTFDAATSTITIPNNQFILHNTRYDKDVVYNGYKWNAAGDDIDIVDGGLKVVYDGKDLVFDENYLTAFEIVDLGYFSLWGDIKVISEIPEEDFSDHDADIAWQDAGTVKFCPGWLSGFFTSDISTVAYDVPVQKHPELEGVYRMVDPYNVASSPLVAGLTNGKFTFKPGYIKFNIADEKAPYIYPEIFSGLVRPDGSGFYCYDILGYYGVGMLSAIQAQLPQYLSTLTDNVITVSLPMFGYGPTDIDAGYNWETIVKATIDLSGIAAVDDVIVDGSDATPVYYNLQGVRVAEPAAGQLVIRVQGDKATKLLVK